MEEWKQGEPAADESAAPETADDLPEEDDFLARDLAEFERRFPDVDVEELEADGMFRRFCGSRYAKEPLAALYADYLGFYLLNGWLPVSRVWIFTVIFVVIFAVTWLIIYLSVKAKVDKMNKLLEG